MDAWCWLPPSRFIWGSLRPAAWVGGSTSGHTSGSPRDRRLFFDARNLTASWECQRLGYDPLYDNPCDPWRRPLMYLRPWLLLGVFGLDQSHTVALAVVLVAAMFVSFFVLVGRVPLGTGILLALAACSPAVMLAVERANMDIALFSLLAASAIMWRAFPGPARIISPLAVLVAATAKVYPVFALPAFLVAGSRVAARVALLCIAVFAAYLLFSLRDVRHVAAIATQGDEFSYGARILIAHLYHQVGADTLARTCDRQTTDRRDPNCASRGSDRDSGPSTF